MKLLFATLFMFGPIFLKRLIFSVFSEDKHTGPVAALDFNPFQQNLLASGNLMLTTGVSCYLILRSPSGTMMKMSSTYFGRIYEATTVPEHRYCFKIISPAPSQEFFFPTFITFFVFFWCKYTHHRANFERKILEL